MSELHERTELLYETDSVPGDDRNDIARGVAGYVIGLLLAVFLTCVSFWVALDRNFIWQPGVGAGLLVLAAAQIGIHLVFFLHLTAGPDNTNNALAVAFGVLIVVLFGAGTIWIMANLSHNMMPPAEITDIHMQH